MRSSIITLVTALALATAQTTPNLPIITAAAGTLGLGDACSSKDQCANGADCYGVTAFTIRRCGGFQASCSSDTQCATNTCVNGLCGGFLASSSSASSASATPTTFTPNLPTVTAAAGSLPLGAACSAKEQCANGADCYGVTAFTIRRCGAFQSPCTSDAQCSTNTCVKGLCNGFIDPSSSAASTLSTSTTTTSAPQSVFSPNLPTVTAAAGSLPLGATCSERSQCQAGVDCYGTTAFTIKTCGSFNAGCKTDAQCATNTCVNGICSGFLASAGSSSKASSSTVATATSAVTAGASGTGATSPVFTGGAIKVGAGSGFAGLVFAAALVL